MNVVRLLCLSLFMLSNGAYASDQPIKKLQAFLKSSKSLTADFKQVLINEAGSPYQSSSGLFYLQRPGKFRWDYLKPFQQQIVSTSGKVWFYDADLEQVTVKTLDESVGSTPALLLSGEISLEDNFIMENQGAEGDLLWIRLLPKNKESSFKYIVIGLNKGVLGGMELSDNFGQLTRIYFSNVVLNPPIKPSVFEFKAPAGADVFSDQ
ncbi:MAG: outer membrane lipoprotein carrier protein LolA [Methylococcales bacterium]|nr:MAG: outer membrane lipoprotein carrier protein LolA [Methylococcales bacterium]